MESSVALTWEWSRCHSDETIFIGEQHGDKGNRLHPYVQGSTLQEASAAGNAISGEAMVCSGGCSPCILKHSCTISPRSLRTLNLEEDVQASVQYTCFVNREAPGLLLPWAMTQMLSLYTG